MQTADYIAREDRYLAHNYKSLPVVFTKGEGVWLWDVEGKKYLDFVGAYSAVSFGHLNQRIKAALVAQLDRLDVQARAFRHDQLGGFAEAACRISGLDMMLPMNTGAEAVETAIKAARRWGVDVKGVADGRQRIIVNEQNFHGRTTTIIGFSSEERSRRGFGPFDGGFDIIPFGDAAALEAAITPDTVAFLTEPILAEAGIYTPPKGWLKQAQEICRKHNVLLLVDEVQTGLGRTGRDFCFQHEIERPDGLMLGKALGGGLYPVSALLGTKALMDVFDYGSHGSTFGGNAVASAIAIEALKIMADEKISEKTAENGEYLMRKLRAFNSPLIKEVRGQGLLIGVEINDGKATEVCEALLAKGLISKDTHHTTLRFTPPLTIEKPELDFAVEVMAEALREIG